MASASATLSDASGERSRHVEPDRRRRREQHPGRRWSVFGPPRPFEQRNQQQASARRAQQIEEVDPVDAFDAFGNRERNDGSRKRRTAARSRSR